MTQSQLGALELTVLLAVVRLDDEAYGLGVRREVSSRTDHDYSVGAIYTTLERLSEKGYVTSQMTEPLPARGGRSRRQFRVTAAGKRAIQSARRQADNVWGDAGITLRPEPT